MFMCVSERYDGEDGTFHKDLFFSAFEIDMEVRDIETSDSGEFPSDVPGCVEYFAMELVRFDATSSEVKFDFGPDYWLDGDDVPCRTDGLLRIYPNESSGMANVVVSRTLQWRDSKEDIHCSHTDVIQGVFPIAEIKEIGKSLLPLPRDVLDFLYPDSSDTDSTIWYDALASQMNSVNEERSRLFDEDQNRKNEEASRSNIKGSKPSDNSMGQHDAQCERDSNGASECRCQNRKNHNDFHRLWTGALAPNYNKKAWLEIERQLLAAGLI